MTIAIGVGTALMVAAPLLVKPLSDLVWWLMH